MFISIAICEKNKERIELLRRILTEMSIEHDCDIQLYWLFGDNMLEKLKDLSDIINLALISMDLDNAAQLGKQLYQENPSCYIMYYKRQETNLEPVFCSRPIAFHQGVLKSDAFRKKLIQIWVDIWSQRNMFYYQSRDFVCLLPYGCISFIQSDYKHVVIHTSAGRKLRLYAKLDDIEKKLEKGIFLRIHKSYIVNISYAESINKTNHYLYLKTGDVVDISKIYYEKTLMKMEQY